MENKSEISLVDTQYITENYTINTEEQNSYDENEENYKLIKEKYNRYKEDSEEQTKKYPRSRCYDDYGENAIDKINMDTINMERITIDDDLLIKTRKYLTFKIKILVNFLEKVYTLYDEIKIKFKYTQYNFHYNSQYKLIQEEKNILNNFNSELDIIYSDSIINSDDNELIKKLIDKVNFLSEKENQIVNNFNKKGFENFETFQKKAKDLQNEKIIQMIRAQLFINLKHINRTIEIIDLKQKNKKTFII